MSLLVCNIVSSLFVTFFILKILATSRKTTLLTPYPESPNAEKNLNKILKDDLVSVIIPAHNEEEYICKCVRSLLDGSQLPHNRIEVIVLNDQSTDNTKIRLEELEKELKDPRLIILNGIPKPDNEVWINKNWACFQGSKQAKGEYFLFIDADIFLKPGAVKAALTHMYKCQADLLSFYPKKSLKCAAEWIVEPPLVLSNLAWPRFVHVSDPTRPEVFTPGWFMFFRSSVYNKIGGHRSVANEVLEDIELGKRTKSYGYRVEFCLGPKLATMRMYESFSELWEGYTKNFYCGLDHKFWFAISVSMAFLWIFTIPYIGFLLALLSLMIHGPSMIILFALGLSTLTISCHYMLRRKIQSLLLLPTYYWWTMGIGGGLLSALVIHSIIKHRSGRGYTWKGQPLPKH